MVPLRPLTPDKCHRPQAHNSQGPDGGNKNSYPEAAANRQRCIHQDALATPRVYRLKDAKDGTEYKCSKQSLPHATRNRLRCLRRSGGSCARSSRCARSLACFAISHFVVTNASIEATYGHAITERLHILRCPCWLPIRRYDLPVEHSWCQAATAPTGIRRHTHRSG